MSTSLRSLISAAVLAAGLPLAAHAAPVSLDFSGLAIGSTLDGQYNDAAHGFTTFLTTLGSSGAVGEVADGHGNVGVVGATGALAMEVGDGFTSISFSYLWDGGTAGGAGSVMLFDAAGANLGGAALTQAGGWVDVTFNALAGAGSRVVFVGPTGLRLDDIHFETTTANPVPEPATAALVALALAGLSSVRRRKG